MESGQRKIFKAKKRVQDKDADKIITEDGEELEFEGDEVEYEEEDVVQNDEEDEAVNEDWEDVGSDGDEGEERREGKKVTFGATETKQIWNEKTDPLKEGEELVFDGSAYEMLHRSHVEWPCLSIDFLVRERIGGAPYSYQNTS